MKKTNIILLSFFVTALFIFSSINTGFTKKTQPPVSRTGAPTESHCGSSTCHNTTPNTSGGTLSVTFNPTTYLPGQVVEVTVATNEAGMTRYGFEGTILDASNTKQGTFAVIDAVTTTVQTGGARQYAGHKNAGTTNSWTFNWTAPSTGAGALTMYVASICANANNSSSGDHCYTTTGSLPQNSVGVNEVTGASAFMNVQNPVVNNLSISFNSDANAKTIIRLFDINGREVKTLLNENVSSGMHTENFAAPTVAGIYFVEFTNGNNRVVKKVEAL